MYSKPGDLRQRIIRGRQKIDQLCQIVDKLPRGQKRDELAEKSVRMLRSLCDLEYGFIELHPNRCLFEDKGCADRNKGSFACLRCPSYLNAILRKALL